MSVAADRLLDAVESGIDLIRRQEVRAEAAAEVESRVDRALQRNKDATRSGAGGALEVDPILVLRLEDVGILVADPS